MRIAVDVGGTKIRVGLISEDGRVLETKKAACPSNSSKLEVVDYIAEMVDEFFSDKVEAIGIGIPAIVDENGIVHDCVNIPSWDVVDLKSLFQERFKVPVSVKNDCNCYALGVKASEGREYDNIVCIMLGTGLGAGLIINGELYTGAVSCAGELGEIKYKDSNYESYCSSHFFKAKGTSGRDACKAAQQNDPAALEQWKEFGQHVGELIEMATLAYSPQAIFIGGSIAGAYPYFEASMREKLANFPYKKVMDNLGIFALDNPDVLLLGAAA